MTEPKTPRYIAIEGPIGVGKSSLAKILAQKYASRLAKDKIFALINLEDDEISLYESIYKLLVSTLPKPDLVIYLQARPEVLLSRVRKRGIAYERNISLDYLRTLSDAYNEYFFHYNETPLLLVNQSEMDFVESPRDLEHLG